MKIGTLVAAILAAFFLSACGTVSEKISEYTGTTIEQRCANYRLVLLQWEQYREAGGEMTPEREAMINAGKAVLDANCGPPAPPAS